MKIKIKKKKLLLLCNYGLVMYFLSTREKKYQPKKEKKRKRDGDRKIEKKNLFINCSNSEAQKQQQ